MVCVCIYNGDKIRIIAGYNASVMGIKWAESVIALMLLLSIALLVFFTCLAGTSRVLPSNSMGDLLQLKKLMYDFSSENIAPNSSITSMRVGK